MSGPDVGDFLATYLLHSTVILGLTLGLLRLPSFRSAAVRDVALRLALITGLVTAAFSPFQRQSLPVLPLAFPAAGQVSTQRPPAERQSADVPIPDVTVTAVHLAPGPTVDWALVLLLGSAAVAALRLSAAVVVLQRGRKNGVDDAGLSQRLRQLAAGTGRAANITVSWTHLQVPCATGLRSILLPHDLPQRLGAPEMDAVLAHECAHLLRRDPLWNLTLTLLAQCLWFQPLNLLVLRAWREASEECCDAWAAHHTPRLTLAQAIVTLAGARPTLPPAALTTAAARTTHLSVRIHALLAPQESRMKRSHLLVLALGPSLLGAAVPPLALAAPARLTVVLDAAHGRPDPGAVGFATEADVVLAVARKTRTLLEKRDVTVVMTRDSDDGVSLEDRIARISPNAAAFVSIHANASENASDHGVTTSIASPETSRALAGSQQLGKSLQTALLSATGLGEVPVNIESNTFYVLRNSPVPAALIEVGYVTNAAEGAALQDAGYQDRLAEAIVRGVLAQH